MSLQTELRQVVVALNDRLQTIDVGVPVSVGTQLSQMRAEIAALRKQSNSVELLAMKIQNGEVVNRG
jgi:hypothetical protein